MMVGLTCGAGYTSLPYAAQTLIDLIRGAPTDPEIAVQIEGDAG